MTTLECRIGFDEPIQLHAQFQQHVTNIMARDSDLSDTQLAAVFWKSVSMADKFQNGSHDTNISLGQRKDLAADFYNFAAYFSGARYEISGDVTCLKEKYEYHKKGADTLRQQNPAYAADYFCEAAAAAQQLSKITSEPQWNILKKEMLQRATYLRPQNSNKLSAGALAYHAKIAKERACSIQESLYFSSEDAIFWAEQWYSLDFKSGELNQKSGSNNFAFNSFSFVAAAAYKLLLLTDDQVWDKRQYEARQVCCEIAENAPDGEISPLQVAHNILMMAHTAQRIWDRTGQKDMYKEAKRLYARLKNLTSNSRTPFTPALIGDSSGDSSAF